MDRANYGASTNFIHILLDVLTGVIAFLLSILYQTSINSEINVFECFVIFVVFMFIYVLMNKDERIYNMTSFFYIDRVIRYITKSFVIAMILNAFIVFYAIDSVSCKKYFSSFIIISYVLFLLEVLFFRFFYKNKGKEHFPRTVYIGNESQYEKFNLYLKKTNVNINLLGYLGIGNKIGNNKLSLGSVEYLESIIREKNVDQVFFINNIEDDDLRKYVDICLEMGVTVKIVMDFDTKSNVKSYVSSIGTYHVVTCHTVSLNNSAKAVKRFMDIVGGLVGIIISSPIMLISAIAIKITSPGPVIFKQERVGMNGRVFKIYKFRTMCNGADKLKESLMEENEVSDGCLFKIKDDPRITKVGKFLRKTSIDELPQFFNVLLGTMSLVGTRPPTLDEVAKYKRSYWRRISIKPGITGMWQVSGRSTITDFQQVVDLDTMYIDEWNVLLDVKVLLKTVKVILLRDGAY